MVAKDIVLTEENIKGTPCAVVMPIQKWEQSKPS
jgi:hypothetical protein